MFVPALVGCALYTYTDYEKIDMYSLVVGILCIFQNLLWFSAVFPTRVSEKRSVLYVACMPELTYYASFLALGVMPVVICTLNLMSLFMVESTSTIAPFSVFSFFCEVAVLVAYIVDFRAGLGDDL